MSARTTTKHRVAKGAILSSTAFKPWTVLLWGLLCPLTASAQIVAPSQVTPRDIAPVPSQHPDQSPLPPTDWPTTIPDNSTLAADTGDVAIDGGFPELTDANAALIATVAHRHVTLREIFEAAHILEQAYANKGYVLVRVSVPPQRLTTGAKLHVVVTDGFIESVDVAHVAKSWRDLVGERMTALIGRRHLTQAALESALLVAADLPGAHLRSAIAPGTASGGVRLMVEGQFDRAAGQIGIDNNLPTSLGRWQFNGNLSLNNMLGLGDQMYLSAGSQVDMARYGFPTATLGMLGGGLTVPLGDAGVTLTGEVLTSRTQPNPVPGAPPSLGNFTRELGRLRIPVIHTRAQTLSLSSSYEIVTQVERLPAFYVQISRDHYAAWRLNASWQRDFGRIPLSVEATV